MSKKKKITTEEKPEEQLNAENIEKIDKPEDISKDVVENVESQPNEELTGDELNTDSTDEAEKPAKKGKSKKVKSKFVMVGNKVLIHEGKRVLRKTKEGRFTVFFTEDGATYKNIS